MSLFLSLLKMTQLESKRWELHVYFLKLNTREINKLQNREIKYPWNTFKVAYMYIFRGLIY